MNKKTEKGLIVGLAVGVIAAMALSSRKVRDTVQSKFKGEDKSKLDAIREILEDKKDAGLEKAEALKEKISEKKNNNK